MTTSHIDYQKLFEDSPLPRLVITRVQKDHFFVGRANMAAVNYFCPKPDGRCNTIEGMYLKDFLDSTNATHIIQAMNVCFETKIPISVQVVPKNMTERQVQSFMLSPILGEGKTVLWIDMQSRPPATEAVAIERERDDAISMFTTVFDVTDVGITVTDHHGRFVRLNDAFLRQTGWDAIDLIGNQLTVLIPPEDQDLAWQRHQEALKEKKKNFGEIRILKKNGETMNVMVTSVMMELSNGRTFRITTVVDITELKQIETDLRRAKEEADEANMAKSAFLANMSHELRTPLNAIIGFSEMMMNGTLGPIENEHYREYLGDIKFSAQHLMHIINDVLDMSKIEAGKMPLDEEKIDIHGLLQGVKRLLTTKADENDVAIRIDNHIVGGKPILNGDERLVRQVFLNLLSNAVKFSHPMGEVVIDIALNAERELIVRIIDKGIGIPKDRLDDVIEPFGQVADPRVNRGQGTGLGLPIAKAMMDMHGGSLGIESEMGQGTTVTCTFPQSRVITEL